MVGVQDATGVVLVFVQYCDHNFLIYMKFHLYESFSGVYRNTY